MAATLILHQACSPTIWVAARSPLPDADSPPSRFPEQPKQTPTMRRHGGEGDKEGDGRDLPLRSKEKREEYGEVNYTALLSNSLIALATSTPLPEAWEYWDPVLPQTTR